MREQVLYRVMELAIRRTRRPDFRIIEFSVQWNHVHFVAEATDKGALARGMQSFTLRANKMINGVLGRTGQLWDDRYHRRDLTTPAQVRNAIVYVINNFRKHQNIKDKSGVVDACSSGAWFAGWSNREPEDERTRPTPHAQTYLLRIGWRKQHRAIHSAEQPRAAH